MAGKRRARQGWGVGSGGRREKVRALSPPIARGECRRGGGGWEELPVRRSEGRGDKATFLEKPFSHFFFQSMEIVHRTCSSRCLPPCPCCV